MSSPFQCDYCWFTNITKRVADANFEADAQLLAYIRRVNLDVFWSKEPSTVGNTLRSLEKGKYMSAELGLPPLLNWRWVHGRLLIPADFRWP